MADEPIAFGRRRPKVDKERIAARAFPVLEAREGVVPLNPGFFQIEAARNAKVAKKRAVLAKRARG